MCPGFLNVCGFNSQFIFCFSFFVFVVFFVFSGVFVCCLCCLYFFVFVFFFLMDFFVGTKSLYMQRNREEKNKKVVFLRELCLIR